jgi:hypothetical protein
MFRRFKEKNKKSLRLKLKSALKIEQISVVLCSYIKKIMKDVVNFCSLSHIDCSTGACAGGCISSHKVYIVTCLETKKNVF